MRGVERFAFFFLFFFSVTVNSFFSPIHSQRRKSLFFLSQSFSSFRGSQGGESAPCPPIEKTALAMFRSRQQQQQQQHADAVPLPLNTTAFNCAASLEGLVEASSSTVSLSASGLCRCGLGGEEVHNVQVRIEKSREKRRAFSKANDVALPFFSFIAQDSQFSILFLCLLLLLRPRFSSAPASTRPGCST